MILLVTAWATASVPAVVQHDEPVTAPFALPADTEPRAIVGGEAAPVGEWPDAAAILAGSNREYACMGTLITPDLVLMAAHCDLSVTSVRLGTHTRDSGGELIDVVQRWTYPMSYSTYDVTLLRLDHASTVTPRALALDCIAEDFIVDRNDAFIVGWGSTSRNATNFPNRLQQGAVSIRDHDCDDSARGCNPEVLPGGELIAGGDGVDTCTGDSGGPLYVLTPGGAYLAGVTSRAVSPSFSLCGDGGIYVRADAVADWIEDVSGQTLPRPTCDGNRRPHPSADALEVRGDHATTVVFANDPDPRDAHTFAIEQGPELGTATVDASGTVTYTRTAGAFGEDQLVVAVTDDADPPLTGRVAIPIVTGPWVAPGNKQGCGCASAAPGATWWLLLLVAGCTLREKREPEEPTPPTPATIAELWQVWDGSWEGAVPDSVRVRGQISSPVTTDGTLRYFLQDGAGPGSAIRVDLRGIVSDWPPPVGTPVELSGTLLYGDLGPFIAQSSRTQGEILGEPGAIEASDWAPDPTLLGALIRLPDLTVTSAPDPLDEADTDGPSHWGGAFGVPAPGWGVQGDLLGIATRRDRISPRFAEDWDGDLQGDDPVDTDIATLRAEGLAIGTPVRLNGLQAAPWGRGGRYTLIQDSNGHGLWVDAEGWGIDNSVEGDDCTWLGEVRNGPVLRVWTDPVVIGTAIPQLTGVRHGALTSVTTADLTGPDRNGDWTNDDYVVDDLFVTLDTLPNPTTLTAAVWKRHGVTRLAPVQLP